MNKKLLAIVCTFAVFVTGVFAVYNFDVKADDPADEKEVFCAFEYDGTNKTAKADLDEYSYKDSEDDWGDIDPSYVYKSTTGDGLLTASTTGTNLKHLSWSKDLYSDVDGNEMTAPSPMINASDSNPWTSDTYVHIDFDASVYENIECSFEIACTKKGPCNFKIVYPRYDEEKQVFVDEVLTTVSIPSNKKFKKVSFELPSVFDLNMFAQLEIKLDDTYNLNGVDITLDENKTSGEFAINNIIFKGVSEEEPTTEAVSETDTTEVTTAAENTTAENTTTENTTVESTTASSVVLDKPTGLAIGETKDVYYVKWNQVPNAESYYIAILQNDKLLYEMPTLDTYMEISKTMIGNAVIPDGKYTIEVWAIGDNGNAISPKSTTSIVFGQEETTTAKNVDEVKVAKAVIKKVYTKKKKAKKLKLKIKACPKYANAASYSYLVKVYKTKNNAKKDKKALVAKTVSKANCTINNKKLKNKKTLFVKVRYVVTFNIAQNNDTKKAALPKKMGAWSSVKKVKIK